MKLLLITIASLIFSISAALGANKYTIVIERGEGTEGTFHYKGNIEITAKCWWSGEVKRPDEVTDHECSATKMATSEIPAIFIPKLKAREIFIHHGDDEGFSLGCIAVETEKFKLAWDDIKPKDGKNVTVIIKDK